MPGTYPNQVKLLVIEDNDDQWMLIEKAIKKSFSKAMAIRVASAQRARNFLEECVVEEWAMPQLILQDLYLPTLDDGLTLLKQVRAMSPAGSLVPIVMLSSSTVQADITKAYEAGISSYCVKPGRFEDWIALFKELRVYWLETATLPPLHYSSF